MFSDWKKFVALGVAAFVLVLVVYLFGLLAFLVWAGRVEPAVFLNYINAAFSKIAEAALFLMLAAEKLLGMAAPAQVSPLPVASPAPAVIAAPTGDSPR